MKKIFSVFAACAVCAMLTACNGATENADISEPAEKALSFDNLKLVRSGMSDRMVFYDLESLENFSDIAVVGRFTGDAEQDITYEYNAFFGKDIVTNVVSYNNIEVTKVLFGDVNVGDELKIGQSYGVVDEQLISFDALTPMQNGDEWLFFLNFEPTLDNSYWCCGDSDGRYPVPNAENALMPLSDSPDLGVYNEEDFNRDIYNEIVGKYNI